MRIRTAVIGLTVLATVFTAAPAVAGPATPPTVSCQRTINTHVTSASLSEFAGQMLAAGKTQQDVEKAFLNQLCLKKVGSGPMVQTSGADAEDIRWNYSSIFYDDWDNLYHATIAFEWINYDWYSDVPYFNGCYNTGLGGPDSLAIRLSGGEYAVYGYSMLIWGRPNLDQYDGDYGWVTQYSASNVSQYGAGFTRQDNARSTSSGGWCNGGVFFKDYDMQNGQIYLSVRALDGNCRWAQVFGDYAHSWSSTSITGVEVGPWSFGVSWAGGESKFESAAGGQQGTIC
jgi:hypothetical protein